MFNWATSKLTALSETLAPPPSTPSHRILSALSQNDENLALSILRDPSEPFDVYASLNNRGMSSIHVAASHGAWSVLREVLGRGVRVDLTDYNGWTALHHASCASVNSLALVKFLVEECSASILLKTNDGSTAYDVATTQAVRGYLLPRQLQLETKECLDNGGKGLMPGIDLGGCSVNYSNLAPPPVIGGPPSTAGGATFMQSNSYDPSAALMQPPPIRGVGASPRQPPPPQQAMMSPIPMQNNLHMGSPYPAEPSANAPNSTMKQQPQQWQPPPVANDATSVQQFNQDQQQYQQPPAFTTETVPVPSSPQVIHEPEQQQLQPTPQPTQPEPTQTQPPQQQLPQPPTSNNSQSYARRGGNANSAFVLSQSKYRPDGFHTSSNDKELQAKYGHVENEFEASRKAAVPPPPKSGGAPISGGVAPPTSGGYNPYSAARHAGGYIGGAGRSRYPTYCALSDSVSTPPSLSGAGYGYAAAAPVPTYANFHQGGFNAGAGGEQNVPQLQQWTGDQQNQHNNYGAGYNQQPYATDPQQQWAGNMQQNQSGAFPPPPGAPVVGYNQQNIGAAPLQEQQQWAGGVQQNQTGSYPPPVADTYNSGIPVDQITANPPNVLATTPSPKLPNQPDAAANLFGTPHADTPKKHPVEAEDSLPSLPIDSSNAKELFASTPADSSAPATNAGSPPSSTQPSAAADQFASPPVSTQSNEAAAVDLFGSPPGSAQPNEAAADHFAAAPSATDNSNHVAEAVTDPRSFFGSPPQAESSTAAASSFVGGEKDAGEQTAEKPDNAVVPNMPTPSAPAAAPVRSYGGLPPPPVIGGMKTSSTPRNFVGSPVGSSLPPPPMVRSSPIVKDDDDAATEQMAEVCLS